MEGFVIIRNGRIGHCAVFSGFSKGLLTVNAEVGEVRVCRLQRALSLVLVGAKGSVFVGELDTCCVFRARSRLRPFHWGGKFVPFYLVYIF